MAPKVDDIKMPSPESDPPSSSPSSSAQLKQSPANDNMTNRHAGVDQNSEEEPAQVIICGAGIVGLVLALALHEHVPGIKPELYEAAPAFAEDVGAAMGMYPNGLRVLRDIDPTLCDAVRAAGHPYLCRRWERHDGTEVAVAAEDVLSTYEGCNRADGVASSSGSLPVPPPLEESNGSTNSEGSEENGTGDDDELRSMGIRRWKLQKILHDAVVARGIPIHFSKRTATVEFTDGKGGNDRGTHNDGDGDDRRLVTVRFDDGTSRRTRLLFGSDGSKSAVRRSVADPKSRLEYTGVTCLMGMSSVARPYRGISFPSSTSTKCHAVFFPTSEEEQCFQFHFPVPHERADEGNWGTLSERVGREECRKLAEKLREDGWDEKYLTPLKEVRRAVRIGFCNLVPGLDRWVYGETNGTAGNNNADAGSGSDCPNGNRRNGGGRVVLLGDAAHPPVPYIGQGAQMGLEDAGVLALLLKHLCLDSSGQFHLSNFGRAASIYERMRIPRTKKMLENSHFMGKVQQKRADNVRYNKVKEELIQRQVFYHENLPVYFPGARYNYREDVERVLREEGPAVMPTLRESEEGEGGQVEVVLPSSPSA